MCAGCTQKAIERAEQMKLEAAAKAAEVKPVAPPREGINCYCGLFRLIPTGLNVNDTFELVPCPRCGTSFKGVRTEDGVREAV